MRNIIKRTTCRVCDAGPLEKIYSLGNLYVSTFLDKDAALGPALRAPLSLVICPKCTLVQLEHTAPQELMYSSHYWYRSALSPVISADLREIARVAAEEVGGLKTGDKVLDIGANDGTLLAAYPDTVQKFGCEPAKNLQDELGKVAEVIPGFWKAEDFMGRKAKVVTAIGMFYDMEDPNQFIADVAKVLDQDGVFIAQLMTLKHMLDRADVGNICHEHIEYYSYRSLVELFERNGLEIYKVEENSINGGSYRLFGRKLGTGSIQHEEPEPDFKDFIARIQRNRDKTVDYIRSQKVVGKKVYAFGASTKGNTIMQWYGLDRTLLAGAGDKSAEKVGKVCVGSLIPIVDEETARKNADVFFVLPYAFIDHFVKNEKKWQDRGGKFLVSTPEFRVL